MASQATPTPASARPDKYEAYIDQQLEKTRARIKLVDLCTGICAIIAWVLGVFLLFAVVDGWIWTLGVVGRSLGLIALVAGVLGISLFYVAPLFLRKINPRYAARMIEQSQPRFKNSLLNYLWVKASGQKVEQAVAVELSQRAAENMHEVSASESVDQSSLIRTGFILVALAVLATGYAVFSPKSPVPTVARVINPFSDISRPAVVRVVSVTPGDADIFFGDVLTIEAEVRGRHEPHDVQLVYSTDDGQHTNVALPMQATGPRRYEVELRTSESGIQQSLQYQVVAKDGHSRWFDVNVRPLPAVSIDSLTLTPPTYTKLPERIITGTGELDAVEGTQVTLSAITNMPIESAYIEFLHANTQSNDVDDLRVVKTSALSFEEQNITGSFLLTLNSDRTGPQFTHYRIRYQSADGDLNSKPNVYPIRITPDLAPEVAIVQPVNQEILLPANGSLNIQIQASDVDYELTAIGLQLDSQGVRVLNHQFELPADNRNRIQQNYWLVPEKISLKPGDQAIFFASAADNRQSPYGNAPDPNVSRTQNYVVTITEPDPQIDEQERDEQIEQAKKEQQRQNQQNNSENKQNQEQDKKNQDDESPQQDQDNSEAGDESENTQDDQQSQDSDSQQQTGDEPDQDQNSGNQSQSGDDGKSETTNDGSESQDPDNQEDSNSDSQPQNNNPENSTDQNQTNDQDSDPQNSESAGNENQQQSNSQGSQQRDDSNAKGQQGNQNGESESSPSDTGSQTNDSNSSQGNRQNGTADNQNSNENATGQQSDATGEGERDDTLQDGTMSDETPDGERIEELMDYFKNKDEQESQNPDSGQPSDSEPSDSDPSETEDPGQSESSDPQDGDRTGSPNEAEENGNNKPDPSEGTGEGNGNQDEQEQGENKEQTDSNQNPGSQGSKSNSGEENQPGDKQKEDPGEGSNSPSNEKPQPGNKGQGESQNQGDEGQEKPGEKGEDSSDGKARQGGSEQESQDPNGTPRSDDQGEPSNESGNQDSKESSNSESKPGEQKSGEPNSSDQNSSQEKSNAGAGGAKGSDGVTSDDNSESNEQHQGSMNNPSGDVKADGKAMQGFERAEREKENLKFSKEATDLVLNRLRDQANDPDPELLKRNNWTRQDLLDFIKSWEQMRDAAAKGGAKEKKLYESRLKSLGLRPSKVQSRKLAAERDEEFGLSEDGSVNHVPAEWVERYNRYMKRRNQVDR